MSTRTQVGFDGIRRFLESLFEGDVHAMRVYSMANATLGVLASASLAVHVIGQGLAHSRGKIGDRPRFRDEARQHVNTIRKVGEECDRPWFLQRKLMNFAKYGGHHLADLGQHTCKGLYFFLANNTHNLDSNSPTRTTKA